MKTYRFVLLFAVAVVSVSHRSDARQPMSVEQQLRLSRVMPRGAVVYLQARDLSSLIKRWLAAPQRAQYYKSQTFTAFSRSRIYLKLAARRKDLEEAIGVGLDESRLAELAGAASALALYDIGKTEMAFVSEVPRQRAVAGALFKQIPRFQERTAGDAVYYVAEVTTDGGRLKQQFCFAHSGGLLLITTAEGLMVRLLRNLKPEPAQPGSDSLLSDVLASARRVKSFAAHDLTLWIDQARLNVNRYFTNNWIHRNAASLSDIDSGLIDLSFTTEGFLERRWFTTKPQRKERNSLSVDQANGLIKFAPADAQLVQLHGRDPASLSEAIDRTLMGKPVPSYAAAEEIPDRTRTTGTAGSFGGRTESYSSLDSRFDADVDDEESPIRRAPAQSSGSEVGREPSAPGFSRKVAALLESASPGGYCEIARSRLDSEKLFVNFERALVVEMKEGALIDRGALERLVTDELRSRFVVAGIEPQLEWQEQSGARYIAQSLLRQGVAYAVSGRYLVLGANRELVFDSIRAAAALRSQVPGFERPVGFYGLVRVAGARQLFDVLMSTLDYRNRESAAEKSNKEGDEGDVKFFSENLSNLFAVLGVREMRVTRLTEDALLFEQVAYSR